MIVSYDRKCFFLQGITNTVGAVPGIVGVALTGYLFDTTHSWSVSNLVCLLVNISFIYSNFMEFVTVLFFLAVVIICPIYFLLLDRNSCLVSIC